MRKILINDNGEKMSEVNSYNGKNILVTAASSRTGKAIAQYLVQQGAILHCVYNRSKISAEKLVEQYGAENVKIYFCDVSSQESVANLFQSIKQATSQLDGLINVVGDYQEGSVADTSYDDWNYMIQNNLNSVFLMCQCFYSLLKKSPNGRVVNFSFTNASKIIPTRCPAYHIAKTGVLILSKTLAKEWGPDKISVNVISPGTLSNSIIKQSDNPADYIPQGRYGEYKDLYPVLDMIFRDDSAYISGNNFKISGAYNI